MVSCRTSMNSDRATETRSRFTALQEALCERFRQLDPQLHFIRDAWQRAEGGGGLTIVATGGATFEKLGVNFSDVQGRELPPAATTARPQLRGLPFRAMGVSVVAHPLNPHVPTAHMNVRFFTTTERAETPVWWFGGGFDLTPYYPVLDDVRDWHARARAICDRFDPAWYPQFKDNCDRYFFLKHRGETRGVGGLFFDDLSAPDFATAAEFTHAVGAGFGEAYGAIVERRAPTPWTQAQRDFQLYRRGRYVEFNLLYDRGTLFGLQSGGRTESILMSLPPLVCFNYDFQPAPDTPEHDLYQNYLRPRDWLGTTDAPSISPQ